MNLQSLYQDLARYQRFSANVSDTIEKIQEALNPLQQATKQMLKTYTYDDVTADNNCLNQKIDNLKKISDYLRTVIIPEINKNISLIRNSN